MRSPRVGPGGPTVCGAACGGHRACRSRAGSWAESLLGGDREQAASVHIRFGGRDKEAGPAGYRGRGAVWRCCMNTRCGWGGVARTSRDPPQEPHYGDEVEGSSQV